MLSVICAQLYDGLEKDEKITLEKVGNLNYTLLAFYEEKIKGIPSKDRKYIEKELVNGGKRRSVPKKEFDRAAPDSKFLYNDKVVSRRILTKFPMPGSGDEHIEFIHDRIAEVVKQRKDDYSARCRRIFLYVVLAAIVVSSLLATFYSGGNSADKNRLVSNLVKCDDHFFTSNDSLWVDHNRISRNAMVETFAIFDKSEYEVSDCPYLSVIDLSKLGRDSLKLTLYDCPVLANIILPDSIKNLELQIYNCPNLQVHINQGLGNLEINATGGQLSFRVDNDVYRYVWYDKKLWDIELKRILFANVSQGSYVKSVNGTTVNCRFPSEIREKQVDYGGITFINTNYDVSDENLAHEGGGGHDFNYRHNSHDTIHRQDIGHGDDFVTLPDSMALIENSLFENCPKLTRVDMPKTLERISDNAFKGCRLLTGIELPSTLAYIGNNAFRGCIHLKEIVIPENVKEIGSSAFEGCSSLKKVIFQGDSLRLGARAFANCSALTDIKLPANCDYPTGNYFSHPFLNCPLVSKELLNNSEAPKTIAKSGNTCFVSGDIILLDDQDHEIHIPPLPRCSWFFDREPLHVTDIFVPYPQPDVVVNNYRNEKSKMSFRLYLDNDLKGGITLHVPYGCKRYYESLPEFSEFRLIEEMTEWEARKDYIDYLINLVVLTLHTWKGFAYLVIYFCLTLVGFRLVRKHKENKVSHYSTKLLNVWAILYPLFISLTALSCFWFLRHIVGWTEPVSGITAVIIALLVISWCYFIEFYGVGSLHGSKHVVKQLSQGKQKSFIGSDVLSKFTLFKSYILHTKWYCLGGVLFVLLMLGVVNYCLHRPNDVQSAVSQGNYKLALQLMSDRVLTTDSLTSTDVYELRQLLIKSGLKPRIVEDVPPLNCDKLYTWGSAVLTAICGDTLHSWYNGTYAKWPMKSVYGEWKYNNTYCAFDRTNHFIVHYNAQNDTSSIFNMKSPQCDSRPLLQLKGRIVGSHLSGPLYWTENDRRYSLSDDHGRTIPLPQEFYNDSVLSYKDFEGHSCSFKTMFPSLLSEDQSLACVNLKERATGKTVNYLIGAFNDGPRIQKLSDGVSFVGFISDGKYVVLKYRSRRPGEPRSEDDEEKIRVCSLDHNLTTIMEFENKYWPVCNGDVMVVDKGNEQFTVYNPDNTVQTIDIEGRFKMLYKHVVYYQKKGQRYLYNSDTGQHEVIEEKYCSSHASILFLGDCLIVYDDIYGVAHVFTFNNKLRHVGEIRANQFEREYGSSYLKAFRGDSVQYYFIDDIIMPGAILPNSISDYYLQKDFITPRSSNEQETAYRIYPLRDEQKDFFLELNVQKEGERSSSDPIIVGGYILQPIMDWRTTEGQILRMHYEGTQELILRSSLSSDRKERLIKLLENFEVQ